MELLIGFSWIMTLNRRSFPSHCHRPWSWDHFAVDGVAVDADRNGGAIALGDRRFRRAATGDDYIFQRTVCRVLVRHWHPPNQASP